MGINKQTFSLLKDFLSERRRQIVVINGVQFQLGAVKSGVLHGSVLGHLLFLIYVSDISEDVSSNVILFADDTKLYSCVERQEDCHTLQEDINKLVNWTEKWLMRFNTEKWKVLHNNWCRSEGIYHDAASEWWHARSFLLFGSLLEAVFFSLSSISLRYRSLFVSSSWSWYDGVWGW